MKQVLLACLLAALAGCSQAEAARTPVAQPSAVSSSELAGSCPGTAIVKGPTPAWLDVASGHNTPAGLAYTIDATATVGGFLFGYPLRAGHPENPTNKILWIVRLPRNGSDLVILGHPAGAASPIVKVTKPADSGPGEIYPSIVDMPTPGCWVLDLAWAGHAATVELPYS